MRDTKRNAAQRLIGMTLVELLLASGLSMALLVLLVSVLIPTMRASARGTVQVALQQSGLVALDRLTADLQSSVLPGVALAQTASLRMASIQPLAQVASDGSQIWDDRLVVYQWRPDLQQVLRKRVRPAGSPPGPFQPDAATLTGYAALPGEEARVLAIQARDFAVTLTPAANGDAQTFQLHLLLEAPVPGRTQPEQVDMNRSVFLRNQTL